MNKYLAAVTRFFTYKFFPVKLSDKYLSKQYRERTEVQVLDKMLNEMLCRLPEYSGATAGCLQLNREGILFQSLFV